MEHQIEMVASNGNSYQAATEVLGPADDDSHVNIVFAPHAKVKIKIDIDQLDWEDFLEFERLATGNSDDPEATKKMVIIARRCVVDMPEGTKLPLSTLRPVIQAITQAIGGTAQDRKN